MTEPAPFEPLEMLSALSSAGVDFVLIGGVAARLHGSPSLTRDIDVCYSRSIENIDRLVEALKAMHARLRGVDEDVPFRLDARSLTAGANFTFTTDLGDLDILAFPSGVDGFDELRGNAVAIEIDGFSIFLVSLDDLIRMKRAANRPKDRAELEILEALKAELGSRQP